MWQMAKRLKQEASGWPSWCVDEEQKKAYIQDYNNGKDIDSAGVRNSNKGSESGFTLLAKLMLNTQCGANSGNAPTKLNVAQFSPQEFHWISGRFMWARKIQTSTRQNTNPSQIDEECGRIFSINYWRIRKSNGKCNIFIACFTTCWARLKLYEALEKRSEQMCSITILIQHFTSLMKTIPHQLQPVTGDYLGDFNEWTGTKRKKEFDFITEFRQRDPKTTVISRTDGKTGV